jgi:hypothetical protein
VGKRTVSSPKKPKEPVPGQVVCRTSGEFPIRPVGTSSICSWCFTGGKSK